MEQFTQLRPKLRSNRRGRAERDKDATFLDTGAEAHVFLQLWPHDDSDSVTITLINRRFATHRQQPAPPTPWLYEAKSRQEQG